VAIADLGYSGPTPYSFPQKEVWELRTKQ